MIIYLTPTISLYSWGNLRGRERQLAPGHSWNWWQSQGWSPDLLIPSLPSVPYHTIGAPFPPHLCLWGLGFCHLGTKTLIPIVYITLGDRIEQPMFLPDNSPLKSGLAGGRDEKAEVCWTPERGVWRAQLVRKEHKEEELT